MNILQYNDIVVYSSVYKYIDSNMFIIINQNKALVIDPHKNDNALNILNGVEEVVILLTHEHADHISGVWWYLENFDCRLICSEKCASKIADSHFVKPLLLSFVIEENDRKNGTDVLSEFKKDYVVRTYHADTTYIDSFVYSWQGRNIEFKAAQGHSVGSSFITIDKNYAFTGDSLLKEYPIIVSFPQGNKKAFLEQTIPYIEKEWSPDTIVFPGHGKPFLLSEIMRDGKIHVELR